MCGSVNIYIYIHHIYDTIATSILVDAQAYKLTLVWGSDRELPFRASVQVIH